MREVLETEEGVALLHRRDKEGHTPLHWACLGGYNNICELLIEKGCPINEHSENDYGPRPIHWACVNGHVVTIDLLIEKGVHIDTTDLNGCSSLIVAAQYGQSLVVSYLLQKGANKFHTDVDQDTALHWGAFKGTDTTHSLTSHVICHMICSLISHLICHMICSCKKSCDVT